MTLSRVLGLALAALAAELFLATGVPAAGGMDRVSITVDRAQVATQLGHKFVFHATVSNRGSGPASGLIAHLNVLSLRTGVYVDPEDWSSHRTRYLAPIPPGGSTTLTWRLEAVIIGSFGVYVAVLSQSGTPQPPPTGPVIQVIVEQKKTLNSGGILPLVLGIPALLGFLAFGLRHRRAR